MRLEAEVAGRFDKPGDCSKLLYAPLPEPLAFRRTRRYTLELSGNPSAAEDFIRRVLVDAVSQDVTFGPEPALDGFAFFLDFGMKPGALDLEKEAVRRYFGELDDPGFQLESLTIAQRIYVFGESAAPDRFVRDVVNPAIHTWNVVAHA